MASTAVRVGALPAGAFSAARAVAKRPALWLPAVRQARALAPRGWWRRRPFLPLPDPDWMAFRMTTAYGDPVAPVRADDLITWLDWSESVARARGKDH